MKRVISSVMLITIVALSAMAARPQAAREATIDVDTRAKLILQTRLSSKLSEVGDPVTAVLDEPIYVGNDLVIPRGTEFRGRVTAVKAAGRGQKAGNIAIAFERVAMPWGDEQVFIALAGIDDWDKNEKLKANDEGKVSGGHRGEKTAENVYRSAGIGGAATGVILLSGGGAAAGAATLGGGLLAGLLLTKGGEIQVNPGAVFRVKFVKPLTLPVSSQSGARPQPIDQDGSKPPTKNN
ncbi:MAG TPA: hypothetical protein VKA60_12835 [Blastocatellia bacterium]|nr:hypothetical protein [Blastocatellia bacterium]